MLPNFENTNILPFSAANGNNGFLAIRILVVLTMLVLVSVLDLTRRSVNDRIWIIFGLIGGFLYVLDLPTLKEAIVIGISIGFVTGISFAMYKMGLFGGADALAIITIAVILPIYNGRPNAILHPLAPIIILTNAILISLVQILANMGRNISYIITQKKALFDEFDGETKSRKAMAFLIGYRATRPSNFAFSMESKENGKKEFDFSLKHAEKEAFCTQPNAWVTPGVPFLLYLTAGTIMMLLVGDLIKMIFFNNLHLLFNHT